MVANRQLSVIEILDAVVKTDLEHFLIEIDSFRGLEGCHSKRNKLLIVGMVYQSLGMALLNMLNKGSDISPTSELSILNNPVLERLPAVYIVRYVEQCDRNCSRGRHHS